MSSSVEGERQMAKSRQRSRLRKLIGIVLVISGSVIWYVSYVKSIHGGLQAGEYVPGFSVYNGSLHFWADSESDSVTHFSLRDLEFLERGSDGGNQMLIFGMLEGPNDSTYKCDFDLPLWFLPAGGLVFLLIGFQRKKRSQPNVDSDTQN